MAAVNPIGLDIGSTSIRAVEVTRGKDGPVIANFAEAPLPAGAVHGGAVVHGPAVTAALAKLWDDARFKTRKVVVGVTSPQAVVRQLTLTNLPDRELRQSLPFQVA